MRRALDFLNLVDRDGRLSLSNLLVYLFAGCAVSSVLFPTGPTGQVSLEVFSGLILALLNYGFKRHQNRLSYPVSELSALREELVQTHKLAEEAKHLASKATFNRSRGQSYE